VAAPDILADFHSVCESGGTSAGTTGAVPIPGAARNAGEGSTLGPPTTFDTAHIAVIFFAAAIRTGVVVGPRIRVTCLFASTRATRFQSRWPRQGATSRNIVWLWHGARQSARVHRARASHQRDQDGQPRQESRAPPATTRSGNSSGLPNMRVARRWPSASAPRGLDNPRYNSMAWRRSSAG
jgi:hypothetical protein